MNIFDTQPSLNEKFSALDYRIRALESNIRALQGNEEAIILGTKCAVKDCMNHTHQGRFVGLLCAPCHSFVSGGDGGGYSQVARNTQREWVGLTDEEVDDAALFCVKSGQSVNAAIRNLFAKLKEKNT
jgi:hypothetical protein